MNIALILSGGTGTRLGSDIPKQYVEVAGKPIIAYCIETISAHPMIDGIQIVADKKWQSDLSVWVKDADTNQKIKGFSEPGETRQLSIRNGLEDIAKYATDADVVMIHDAARPNLSGDMITEGYEAIQGHDGVLPVLPMKDTVYSSDDGKSISSLLDRSKIFAGQAPEWFVLGKYREANNRLMPEAIKRINGSTEPAILAGMDVVMIPGDESNYKITTKADLDRFCQKNEGV